MACVEAELRTSVKDRSNVKLSSSIVVVGNEKRGPTLKKEAELKDDAYQINANSAYNVMTLVKKDMNCYATH